MKVSESPTTPPLSRVAVVTGAAGIIGPALCATLRQEGWRVAACDLSAARFRDTQTFVGSDAMVHDGEFYADLTSASACKRLILEVEERLGPVALIVHAAIDGTLAASIHEISPEHFSRGMALAVGAPLFLTQAALPSLTRARGSVILISSVRVHAFAEGSLLYSTAKAAVEKLTEALAFELSESGVRINCIRVGSIPGWGFAQPILEKLSPEQRDRLCAAALPGLLSGHGETDGIRKRGVAGDVAAAVRYLASKEAEFVQGAILPVDGGLPLRARPPSRASAIFEQTQEWMKAWLENEGLGHLLTASQPSTGGAQ